MRMRTAFGICGVCLVMALVQGCGKSETEVAAGKKTVTIWWAQWAPADGLQQLGDEFEKETGIAVKVHQIPWTSYQDQVFLNFGNRQTDFDIVVGDSQWIGRCATRGLYLELTDWLPTAVDMGTVNERVKRYMCEYPAGSGRYYAAPCETDAIGFAYRKDWFENAKEKEAFKAKYGRELGAPDTWEEFRDIAEFFYRPEEKRYGCAPLTGRGYDSLIMGFQQIMWTFGGAWGDPGTYRVDGYANSDASVESLKFLKELLKFAPKGASNFGYDGTLEAFTNGSTAMVMDYFAFFPGIVEAMGEKAGFFVLPRKGDRRIISLGGQGLSISAKVPSQQQEVAKKFVAWFLQTKIQKQWITKPAGFTANTEILSSEEFQKANPYNKAFAESLECLQDFWNVPEYNELLAIAQQYVGEALDGVKTPEEALNAIVKEHEAIFVKAELLKGE